MTTQSSPLEGLFNIEAGSTQLPEKFAGEDPMNTINERSSQLVDPTTGEMVVRSSDADLIELEKEERIEDLHIDGQLENIHTSAVDAFKAQSRLSQEVDPKFSARNAEVAAQYLTIALNAVNSRVDAKHKRQKIRIAKQDVLKPNSLQQNLIVADRNDILRSLFNRDSNGVSIDGAAT